MSGSVSHTGKAIFFRTLAAAFPELLDLLCSTDTAHTRSINKLFEALEFLSLCIISIKESQKTHLHTSVCHMRPT